MALTPTGTSANFWLYQRKLSPGWMYGRQVDASDAQYRTFRGNFWPLLALVLAFTLPSHIARKFWPGPQARSRFLAAAGIVLLVALHGVSAIKVLLILGANYAAAKAPKAPRLSRAWPAIVIIANMMMLFANEKANGYQLGMLTSSLAWLDTPRFAGILPRWHVGFNITMLRIVSFALDAHWAEPPPAGMPADHRARTSSSVPAEQYNLSNYLAYTLYAPLYIAGPIMTFNDFVWQMQHPVEISGRSRIAYAARFAFCMLTMESILHTMYVVAIKDAHAWTGDSPAELSMIGFWNLIIVWLKVSPAVLYKF
jgi:D-alanyl-lipoteichoic acid acyltransferase DltB (MBOAT superfamily)